MFHQHKSSASPQNHYYKVNFNALSPYVFCLLFDLWAHFTVHKLKTKWLKIWTRGNDLMLQIAAFVLQIWWNWPHFLIRHAAEINLIWLDMTKWSLCRTVNAGQTRSWSCSGLWRDTSWVWCQWTSVTMEPSLPPAPSMLTSVSGTWSPVNRSNPWTQDQVRLGQYQIWYFADCWLTRESKHQVNIMLSLWLFSINIKIVLLPCVLEMHITCVFASNLKLLHVIYQINYWFIKLITNYSIPTYSQYMCFLE